MDNEDKAEVKSKIVDLLDHLGRFIRAAVAPDRGPDYETALDALADKIMDFDSIS